MMAVYVLALIGALTVIAGGAFGALVIHATWIRGRR